MNVSITLLKKIVLLVKKTNQKYVTVDFLSEQLAIYPEKIAETLSYFNPLILMDMTGNVRDYLLDMEQYLLLKQPTKITPRKSKSPAIDIKLYKNLVDFIYQHMTIDGIVDKSLTLSLKELKAMKKILLEEIKTKKNDQ